MKKGLTEIVFILDKSGSMHGLEADTIGGFNSFIEKQRKEEGEAFVSTVMFSDNSTVVYDRVPLDKIEPMTDKQYRTGGCTALLDAVGDAISHIKNVHKYAREEDVPEKTIFVIITDGHENSSTHTDYSKLKKSISLQQEKNEWEFIFLGANIDAVGEASKLGIREDRAVKYKCDSRGTEINFASISSAVCSIRKMEPLKAEWKKIIQDYEEESK